MSMQDIIYVVNAAAVGLFGALLSASFCDIRWTKKNRLTFIAVLMVVGVLQAFLYSMCGAVKLREWYPIITHLPLVILFICVTHKLSWSAIVVLTAYLCCQLRRWSALLAVEILDGGVMMQDVVEIIVTVPLLIWIIRFASPAVREISHYPIQMQLQFGVIPAISYMFDYMTRIYTDWLVQGVPAAVEFMPCVCAAVYLFFILHSSKILQRQNEMEQMQTVLDLQVRQSAIQISDMKKSQEMAASYRHDLRHHLQYLSSCIEHQSYEQAQEYIYTLNEEIIKQPVKQYCENTCVNLIISAFAERASDVGVGFKVYVQLGEFLHVSDNDLCIILSNALENALHACISIRDGSRDALIEIRGFVKENKVFLEIANSCDDNIIFESGIPVTKIKGHGIGVRSICATVQKYGGVQNFELKEGRFILRMSI